MSDDRQREDNERLFLPAYEEGWRARIKSDWNREYCFAKYPDEDYHHLLLAGEIYVQYEEEKYCLDCAFRRGLLTRNRLHWQHGGSG